MMTTAETTAECDKWLDTLSDARLDDHSQRSLANEAWKRGAAHAAQKILDHLESIDTLTVKNRVHATAIGNARITADGFIKQVKE